VNIRKCTTRRVAGLTLLEMIASVAAFSMLGSALMLMTRAGKTTERSISDESDASRSLRTAARMLRDELRSSSNTRIVVTHLPDGNDQVRFPVPVQVGTVLDWGVFDPSLGGNEAAQNRAGWCVCYTVESVTQNGQTMRRLLRQELDQALHVQRQRVVLDRLRGGTGSPAGFTVHKQGAVWQVTLSAEPRGGRGQGIQEGFDVQARNQD
jgi:hypothetical protein